MRQTHSRPPHSAQGADYDSSDEHDKHDNADDSADGKHDSKVSVDYYE